MNLALFDFDGTITDRETMPDFMQAAVRPGRLALGKVVLLPLILGYRAKLVPGSVIRAVICRFGFWRVPVRELQMHGERFAVEYLPARLRPEAMARIEWHKSRGDTVVVVSGGLDVYLRHWCRDHGVELLCSSLEERDGRLTGRYRGRQCVRSEKARLVREYFPPERFSRVFAYGDTQEDQELLCLAHEPYYQLETGRWEGMRMAGTERPDGPAARSPGARAKSFGGGPIRVGKLAFVAGVLALLVAVFAPEGTVRQVAGFAALALVALGMAAYWFGRLILAANRSPRDNEQ